MHAGTEDFLDEQTKGLADFAEHLRKSRLAAARQAAIKSAARIRSLNGKVRALARSGVKLTSISQGTVQSLIELQADIVNDGLTDAAAQIERIAYTGSVRDLAREQAEVLKAARERIAGDLTRAMTILRKAAQDARKVGERQAAPKAAKRRKVAKKKKVAARKTKAAARKTKAVSRKPVARRKAGAAKRKAKSKVRKSARRGRATKR
ncbi:MAG: phasin family protein [Steroidobacteraceae bacterium]|nr:phasin family protein [Steroidobacteraceae bacterium]